MPATELQALVTAVVDGQPLGVFDKRTGGDMAATESKYRPGGMGPEKSYTSLPSAASLTVSRVFENERDVELMRALQAKAGRVSGSVSEQPLDADGNAYGAPITFSGLFLGVKWGNMDSTSNTPRQVELDFSITTIA